MPNITHYAIRDLHALLPTQYREGEHDVLAKLDTGTVHCSEALFNSAVDARVFRAEQIKDPGNFGDTWRSWHLWPEVIGNPEWVSAEPLTFGPNGVEGTDDWRG